jgi:VWFA-related protein
MRLTCAVCLGVFAAAVAVPRAQTPDQQPRTISPDDQPTFRVGTRIATIDAVVVDKDGRHVTDLTPADFEVVERGKAQTVRQSVYVRVVGPDGTAIPQPAAADRPAVPTSPPSTTATTGAADRPRPLAAGGGLASPERVGRVIAIVVDDLGLSFESTAYVRQMLTRYVDTKIGPGDLVAIIRTAGGVGTLQQFTTDRRLLHAAIERVRWSLQSRSGVAAFEAVVPAPLAAVTPTGDGTKLKVTPDELKAEITAAGSMGALEYVLRGIEALPGRKAVVFVSEGFELGIRDAKASRTWSAFTRVMDRANRAGVVVYSMDPRGLQTGMMAAEDNPQTAMMSAGPGGAPTGVQLQQLITGENAKRNRALMDTQESLTYLAEQTGGFAVLNTNGLFEGLARAIDDTRGYYLVGFDTAIPVNERWDPNDVRIRVTRPGLTLRARRGLFGPAEKDRPRDGPPTDPLVAAALTPFSSGSIDVRLTTLFAHDKTAGSYVRTLFFIDPAGLTFVDGPDGRRDADLTLLMLAVGDNGQAVAQARLNVPLRLDPEAFRLLRQRGLLYSARVGIKEPGGYQIRAAVQDDRSAQIGTSAQFVEVPKVGKGRVALSSVVMMDVAALRGRTPAEAAGNEPATNPDRGPAVLAADAIGDGVLGEPAIKIFKAGSEVVYTCEIYDGRGKREEGFSTQATLLRDGRPFYTTPPSPVGAAPKDAKPVGAVPVGGTLSLGAKLPRGTYTLQVSVGPRSGNARDRQASQWVDFEVR